MELTEAVRRRSPPPSTIDISRLGTDASERARAVREYAAAVFDSDIAAATWLGRRNRSVLNASCTVLEASLSPQGFVDAMLELGRIEAGVVESPWRTR